MSYKKLIIDGAEMTYEEAHRMLWNYMAATGEDTKDRFFTIHDIRTLNGERFMPWANCFACEIAGEGSGCMRCPIVKFRTGGSCVKETSIYEQWNIEREEDRKKALALEIANLAWEEC